MANILRVEFPNHFSACYECEHALKLSDQVDAQKIEAASQKHEVPHSKAVVHCTKTQIRA